MAMVDLAAGRAERVEQGKTMVDDYTWSDIVFNVADVGLHEGQEVGWDHPCYPLPLVQHVLKEGHGYQISYHSYHIGYYGYHISCRGYHSH